MTDRNASIVDENIQTPLSPIDALKAGFDRVLVGDIENIRFDFCTAGTKGGFGLFNGFLIAIKQRDGSTSFDEGCCCRSPDPVAAARDDSYLPIKAKTFKHLFSQIGSTTQVRDMRSSRGTE
jgi:hypothetical protein